MNFIKKLKNFKFKDLNYVFVLNIHNLKISKILVSLHFFLLFLISFLIIQQIIQDTMIEVILTMERVPKILTSSPTIDWTIPSTIFWLSGAISFFVKIYIDELGNRRRSKRQTAQNVCLISFLRDFKLYISSVLLTSHLPNDVSVKQSLVSRDLSVSRSKYKIFDLITK